MNIKLKKYSNNLTQIEQMNEYNNFIDFYKNKNEKIKIDYNELKNLYISEKEN